MATALFPSSINTSAAVTPGSDLMRGTETLFGGAGSNQFTSLSSAVSPQTATPPGIVPPATPTSGVPGSQNRPTMAPGKYQTNIPGSYQNLGGGNISIPTMDPQFTNQFYQWLSSQMGQGATPFNLSAVIPSTGQATAPGTLTAPLNPIESSLADFYRTGSTASGPMPGVLPMWNAAIAAMNSPTGATAQNEALMRGQFAFGGNLASSPFGNAMQNFASQNALNQNALLTQATQQALPGMEAFGANLQQLDQSSINNMLAEFIRTRPEYSPLLNMMFGGATTSPGVIGKTTGVGGVGAALGGAGTAAAGIADLYSVLHQPGSSGGPPLGTGSPIPP